eukprot:11936132-Karenia_brevis.AAC.1
MESGRWAACRQCGKLVSRTVANGMHRRCFAEQQISAHVAAPGNTGSDRRPVVERLSEMPSLQEICEAQI